MQNKKLAIIVSHPIQYYSPLFRELAKEIDLVVFYGYKPGKKDVGAPGFGIEIEWDIDLLGGYNYHFFHNISKSKKLGTFKGVKVPENELEKAFKQHKITHCIVFGWLYRYYWQVYFYCVKNKIPLAVRGDSILPPKESAIKKTVKSLLYPHFIKKYHTVFYVGKRNLAYMKHFGAKEKQLKFSPHAVDQNFWKPEKIDANNKKTTTNLLWVGKFSKIKRPMDMLKAYKITVEKYPALTLTMVGTGELFNEVKKYKEENQLSGVILPGFKNQTELLSYYSNADILMLTSQSETWGLVVNEAFSCGIPAIVSDNCGCKDDLIDEGKTGYSYQTGNIKELADKIQQFISDKSNVNFSSHINKKNAIYSYAENVKAFKKFLYTSD